MDLQKSPNLITLDISQAKIFNLPIDALTSYQFDVFSLSDSTRRPMSINLIFLSIHPSLFLLPTFDMTCASLTYLPTYLPLSSFSTYV